MRPVNLIPPEERRGSHGVMRTGPVAYIVIGALVLVLAGVTALALTENQIADSKSEVNRVNAEASAAQAEAHRLAAYTQFQALHEQRVQTIASLADSRFDWERVMRELALVLPHDAWLVNMTASASAQGETGATATGGGSLRSSIPGPALEIEGCAVGQEAVAGFVTDLKQIDGVTRVGVESSELPSGKEGAGSSESSSSSEQGGSTPECRTRDFITQFKLTVAFDAAPVSAATGEGEAAATEIAESTSESTETSPEGG